MGDKWIEQEYTIDSLGFTHAEYVCSYILKENPHAEIVLVPIINKNQKCSVKDMIEGLELLINQNVNIINLSLGDEYRYHEEIDKVCQNAIKRGILIISAHSNRKCIATYPASFSFVLGVKCLSNIENPSHILKYNDKENNIIFNDNYFSLYHLGIPKFHQGNSFACAVVSGFLSNFKNKYKEVILRFSDSIFNRYYPYKLLKKKKCYFLTNRIEDSLEQKFIKEITNTVICEPFEEGINKLIAKKAMFQEYQVVFIDHSNYMDIYNYRTLIKKYIKENWGKELVLRYPVFNLYERLALEKDGVINQFSI